MPTFPHCVLEFTRYAFSTEYAIAVPETTQAIPVGLDLEGHSPSRWCKHLNIPLGLCPSVVRMLDDWTEYILGPSKGMCVIVGNDDVGELRPHWASFSISLFTT